MLGVLQPERDGNLVVCVGSGLGVIVTRRFAAGAAAAVATLHLPKLSVKDDFTLQPNAATDPMMEQFIGEYITMYCTNLINDDIESNARYGEHNVKEEGGGLLDGAIAKMWHITARQRQRQAVQS